ncbi:hypothetical protein Acsp06_43570 [Actinomycetospora sp. NBRC 106375]|nr:hypothetical protein Acsp06_43570 [Actinomycetospora sp. NBRC 106375]
MISERIQPGVTDTAVASCFARLRVRPRHAVHGDLGEVVEGRDAVVRGVVLRGAVGDLDEEPAGAPDQQRQGEVGGGEVGVHCEVQHPHAVVEVVLPHGLVPPDELLAAPDVVDQHVEAPLVAVDPLDESADLVVDEVVDRDGDAHTAGSLDELRGLLDRLGAVVLRAAPTSAAPGDVDRGTRSPELDRDPSPPSSGRPGDEGDRVRQRHGCHSPYI